MKRVDITKSDDGKFQFEVRDNNTEDVQAEGSGYETLTEAVTAVEELRIEDDYFIVAASDDRKSEASEDAVTTLADDDGVRASHYEADNADTDEDVPTATSQIETLG